MTHVLLLVGKGMGFGDKMAQALLQQASVKQLIANDQKAVIKKVGGPIVYPENVVNTPH